MNSRCFIGGLTCCATILAVTPFVRAQGTAVTLQWFESSWRTMEDRTADAFAAGYQRIWAPPVSKGESGGFSIGYDTFDRFDLGTPGSPTRYGTEREFVALVNEQDKAGIATFVDLIINHNSFKDNNTPGFEASGDYPGFVLSFGGDPHGDFHPRFDDCGADPIICRIAGLIDIAQEKNHVMIRHPVEANNPQNIPAGSFHDKPNEANRQYYSDLGLPANSIGIHPFNIGDPMAGDAVPENATGLLMRNLRWLIEVIGVDGFRVDAVKHMPDWFLRDFFDRHVWNRATSQVTGEKFTPFSFGEFFEGNVAAHGGYICKGFTGNCNGDGGVTGNRDTLDFPLYFKLRDELNGTGLGVWSNITGGSVDAVFDGDANDGDFGVQFVEAHDASTGPPAMNNLAYAYILTRTGSPIVYFQAGEFGSVEFPRGGRGDALGGQFGNIMTSLVDVHNEYVRGAYFERWIDGDLLVYERNNACIVGLNDRADSGFDERTVQTTFPQGLRLKELTGNATSADVDPNNDIFDVVTVGSGGLVTIRVPRVKNPNGVQHDKNYVIYGPFNPDGELTLTNVDSTIPPEPGTEPNGTRRITPIDVMRADSFEIILTTTDPDAIDPGEDDLAMFRIDVGTDANGNGGIDALDPNFVGFGYENFLTENRPLETDPIDDNGTPKGRYRQVIDATQLSEGRHYISVIAFRSRPGGSPPIFETWRKVILIDRTPPDVELISPTPEQTITSVTFPFRVQAVDRSANSVHMLLDQQPGDDVVAKAQGGQGQANQIDLDLFERTITNLGRGNHRLDVVAFEQGRPEPSVETFTGITVSINDFDGLGDINNDGKVTNRDIWPFVEMVNNGDTFNPRADLNGDGVIDAGDAPMFGDKLIGAGLPESAVQTMLESISEGGEHNAN